MSAVTNEDLSVCERLARRFYRALDRHEIDAALALAAEDCQWIRAGEPQVGHDAMRKVMEARPRSILARHLVGNAVAEPISDSEIVVSYDLLFLAAPPEVPEGVPRPLVPSKILSGVDRYRREEGGWYLIYKRAVPEF